MKKRNKLIIAIATLIATFVLIVVLIPTIQKRVEEKNFTSQIYLFSNSESSTTIETLTPTECKISQYVYSLKAYTIDNETYQYKIVNNLLMILDKNNNSTIIEMFSLTKNLNSSSKAYWIYVKVNSTSYGKVTLSTDYAISVEKIFITSLIAFILISSLIIIIIKSDVSKWKFFKRT